MHRASTHETLRDLADFQVLQHSLQPFVLLALWYGRVFEEVSELLAAGCCVPDLRGRLMTSTQV